MAYDPNFPPDHQELDAEPFRNQYNALKALNDALEARVAALEAQVAALQTGKASAIPNVDTSNTDISNPVTGEQGQAMLDKINEMIMGLKA